MTERAKKLLLLYCKQGGKIRRVSGLPLLTFKAKKAGTLKNYRIYGNTETKTRSYSGAAPLSFPITDGVVSNYRVYGQTSRNLFISRIEQGSYSTIDGQALSSSERVRSYIDDYIYLPVGTYTITATGVTHVVCYSYSDKSLDTYVHKQYFDNWFPLPCTFTNTANAYYKFAFKKSVNNQDQDIDVNNISNIMLNVGSTALPYEPYGESVGDKTENLFDKTKTNRQYNVARNADGSMNYNPSSSNYFDYYIPVKPNTKYVAKGTKDISINMSHTPSRMYFFDADKNWLGRTDIYISDNNHPLGYIVFTTPANCFFTQVQEDTGRPIDPDKFMIVEGTTVPENYIPYGYRIPITNNAETANIYLDEPLRKVGDEAEYVDYATQKWHRMVRKNLFDPSTNIVYGSLSSDGTFVDYDCSVVTDYIPISAGIYTFNTDNPNLNYGYLCAYNSGKQHIAKTGKFEIWLKPPITFSMLEDGYIRVVMRHDTTIAPIELSDVGNIMLNVGAEVLPYEPYIENTEVDVTLPALPAQSSTNSLSVGTAVQPSSVAVDVGEIVSCGDRIENLFDGTFIHRSVIIEEVGDDNPNRRSIVIDISNFNNGDKITFSSETSAGNIFQMYQVSSPLKGGRLLNTNVISGNSETLLATITLDNIANYHYLMIFLNGATNPITDEELLASKIIVNVGNTPLPYEQYGYKVPVTVEGKNLFDINMITANAFINVTTGDITASSTANANVSDFIPVLSGENYVFSFDAELQAGFTFVIAYYDEDKTYLQTKSNYNSSSLVYHYQLAFTPTNNGFIRIKYSSNSINMQLEKGSEATTYEPYHAPVTTTIYLPEPIKMVGDEAEYIDYAEQKMHRVRKNLFDPSKSVVGYISTNGGIVYSDKTKSSDYIDISEDLTYTLTLIRTSAAVATNARACAFYDVDKHLITPTMPLLQNADTITTQINVPQGAAYFRFSYDLSYGNIMLNSGSTAQPYIENTDLDVTLPVLPTLPGINEVSVGTEVQPSGVEIKGRIKAAGGD